MKLIILSFLTSLVFICTINSQTVTQLTGFDIPNSINTKYIDDITRLNDESALVSFELPAVLWRSDGTKSGSFILHDWTKEYSYEFSNNILGVINNKAIMLVPTDSLGKEIWVSDGTVLGTHLLVDFIPGPIGLVKDYNHTNTAIIINNECYFLGLKDGKFQIIKTDGTKGGTYIYINDIDNIASVYDMPKMFLANNNFCFIYNSNFYKIDYQSKNISKIPFSNALDLIDLEQVNDSTLVFISKKNIKYELNRFNLNNNNILKLKTFDYSPGLYYHKLLYKFNNGFYFCGNEGTNNIYKTDGTLAGTKMIKSVEMQTDIFIEYNNKLWFENFENNFYSIFSIDQSENIVKELDSKKFAGGEEKGFILLDNNKFFLSGSFIQTGFDWEPHIYDPSTGMLTIYNINTFLGSYPELVTKLKDNNYLFYAHDDDWDGSLFLLNLKPNSTLNQSSFQDIKVYPNPANLSWTIDTKTLNSFANYRIIDILGNELTKGQITNPISNINATTFNKGIYFMEIQSKEIKQTVKLIKE